MTVEEVVITAAKLLGIEREVALYINENANAGKDKAERLLTCFNLVESELALDYFPLFEKERCVVQKGKVAYEQFSQTPLRVSAVLDELANAVSFKVYPTELRVDSSLQNVVVEYAYLPLEKNLRNESDYQSGVSVGLAAYGVAAEYSAMLGLYAESAFWKKKYKEAIAAAFKMKRGGRVQSRKWI